MTEISVHFNSQCAMIIRVYSFFHEQNLKIKINHRVLPRTEILETVCAAL